MKTIRTGIHLSLAFAAVSLLSIPCWAQDAQPDLTIVFFDIGQADSQLIFTPEASMLIDVGTSREDPGDQSRYLARRVTECLGSHAVEGEPDLDYVLITHFHGDHVGAKGADDSGEGAKGLYGLLDSQGITVDTLVDRGDEVPFGDRSRAQKDYVGCIDRWKEEGKIRARKVAELGDDLIALGNGVDVEIVAVNANDVFESLSEGERERLDKYPPSENDYSIALKITLGDFEYFTGGDLSGKDHRSYHDVESQILDEVGDVEVMKVNHHGSSHSTNPTFLRKLDPEVSVICSGENTYPHPKNDVCRRLRRTCRTYITSDVSSDYRRRLRMHSHIAYRDVVIRVYDGGERYTVLETDLSSFSEEQEANGVDEENSFPRVGEHEVPPPDTIRSFHAHDFINKTMAVEGRLASVYESEESGNVYLNFAEPYYAGLSCVVFPDCISVFDNLPEMCPGLRVRVSGRIKKHRGQPQIVLTEPEQIVVLGG